MGLPKQLTPKQIKFAQELVYNEGKKTATQCAVDAKYSEDRAHVTASELQNPKLYPPQSMLRLLEVRLLDYMLNKK